MLYIVKGTHQKIVCKIWSFTVVSTCSFGVLIIHQCFINMFADDAFLYTMGRNLKRVNDYLQNNVTNVHH